MSTNPPAIKGLARHLLQTELSASGSPSDGRSELTRVCEKLRVPIVKLAGKAGFASLLSRSLSLAVPQDKSLACLAVSSEGSLSGVDALSDDPAVIHQAAQVLVAEFLGLLVAIIGESLTRSVVNSAWPDASRGIDFLGIKESS